MIKSGGFAVSMKFHAGEFLRSILGPISDRKRWFVVKVVGYTLHFATVIPDDGSAINSNKGSLCYTDSTIFKLLKTNDGSSCFKPTSSYARE